MGSSNRGIIIMSKIIYVNGSIIVDTQYFVPKDIGVGYSEPPVGAIVVEPTDEVEGMKCLLIDDDHPQSLFNAYYAKDGTVSGALAASYVTSSYLNSIHLYGKRIGETIDVIKRASEWPATEKALLYKMAYVNILTALDAFICYVLLKRSMDDEVLFKDVMYKLAPKSKKDKWDKLISEGRDGEWEQDAIRFVQETSLLNTEKIDDAFKEVKFKRLEYDRERMDGIFKKRHLLVHRNGRQRDDEEFVVTYEILKDLVDACHTLVGAIFDSICITLDEEMKNQRPERPIEEVFPGGVVRIPFKLSDLARLLRSGEEQKPFEPIQMPVL